MKEDDRCDNCAHHDVYCDEHTDKNGVTTKYHDGCICGFEGAPYSEVRKFILKIVAIISSRTFQDVHISNLNRRNR